jgi:hypothetical protein
MEKAFEVSQSGVRRVVAIVAGICRHCGCTEDQPCTLAHDTCLLNMETWVCNGPNCIRAEESRKRLIAAARPRRLNSADVHASICGRGRKRSCKAARPRGTL